jgi:hypothetical protein
MAFLNAWWVYLVVGMIFAYVLMQSAVFLIKARRKALLIGFTKEQINQTITSSAVFTIAPSVAILIGLVTLAKIFGPMLAGMRLGTLGALTYELPTATLVLRGFGFEAGDVLNPRVVTTALWVMTFGCIPPLLIIPFFFKKYNARINQIKDKDNSWNQIMMDALFIGMISAFVGFVVAPKTVNNETFISVLAILVFLTSAFLIVIFGLMMQKFKWAWLKNYALPLSMIGAMAFAILYASLGVR